MDDDGRPPPYGLPAASPNPGPLIDLHIPSRNPDERNVRDVLENPLSDEGVDSIARSLGHMVTPRYFYLREAHYTESRIDRIPRPEMYQGVEGSRRKGVLVRHCLKRRWEKLGVWNSAWGFAGRRSEARDDFTRWTWPWQPADAADNRDRAFDEAVEVVRRAVLLRRNMLRGEHAPTIPRSRPRPGASVGEGEAFIISRPWFQFQLEVAEETARYDRLTDEEKERSQHSPLKQVIQWCKERGEWRAESDGGRILNEELPAVASWKWRHESPSPEPEDVPAAYEARQTPLEVAEELELTPSEVDDLERIEIPWCDQPEYYWAAADGPCFPGQLIWQRPPKHPPPPAVIPGSLFGPQTNNERSLGIFGSRPLDRPAQSPVFGFSPPANNEPASGIFGSLPSDRPAQSPVFGFSTDSWPVQPTGSPVETPAPEESGDTAQKAAGNSRTMPSTFDSLDEDVLSATSSGPILSQALSETSMGVEENDPPLEVQDTARVGQATIVSAPHDRGQAERDEPRRPDHNIKTPELTLPGSRISRKRPAETPPDEVRPNKRAVVKSSPQLVPAELSRRRSLRSGAAKIAFPADSPTEVTRDSSGGQTRGPGRPKKEGGARDSEKLARTSAALDEQAKNSSALPARGRGRPKRKAEGDEGEREKKRLKPIPATRKARSSAVAEKAHLPVTASKEGRPKKIAKEEAIAPVSKKGRPKKSAQKEKPEEKPNHKPRPTRARNGKVAQDDAPTTVPKKGRPPRKTQEEEEKEKQKPKRNPTSTRTRERVVAEENENAPTPVPKKGRPPRKTQVEEQEKQKPKRTRASTKGIVAEEEEPPAPAQTRGRLKRKAEEEEEEERESEKSKRPKRTPARARAQTEVGEQQKDSPGQKKKGRPKKNAQVGEEKAKSKALTRARAKLAVEEEEKEKVEEESAAVPKKRGRPRKAAKIT
ncbi:hypothetical protein F5Y17DRAFT_455683 [Xylariaceae sp. FL0594]|nr:hypothetical protein F5Y17DRAFT_455683 [Xylariaceae sp. FL0594]